MQSIFSTYKNLLIKYLLKINNILSETENRKFFFRNSYDLKSIIQ
jgi:hypothetical protein